MDHCSRGPSCPRPSQQFLGRVFISLQLSLALGQRDHMDNLILPTRKGASKHEVSEIWMSQGCPFSSMDTLVITLMSLASYSGRNRKPDGMRMDHMWLGGSILVRTGWTKVRVGIMEVADKTTENIFVGYQLPFYLNHGLAHSHFQGNIVRAFWYCLLQLHAW